MNVKQIYTDSVNSFSDTSVLPLGQRELWDPVKMTKKRSLCLIQMLNSCQLKHYIIN